MGGPPSLSPPTRSTGHPRPEVIRHDPRERVPRVPRVRGGDELGPAAQEDPADVHGEAESRKRVQIPPDRHGDARALAGPAPPLVEPRERVPGEVTREDLEDQHERLVQGAALGGDVRDLY